MVKTTDTPISTIQVQRGKTGRIEGKQYDEQGKQQPQQQAAKAKTRLTAVAGADLIGSHRTPPGCLNAGAIV